MGRKKLDLTDEERKERAREYGKKWRAEHPGYLREYGKKWNADNPRYRAEYYLANATHLRARGRAHYADNRERLLKQVHEWNEAHPLQVKWLCARARAKALGVPFTLTLSDMRQPAVCPVLGLKLRMNQGVAKANSLAMDRLHPRRGYTKENVVFVSHRVNTLKGAFAPKDIPNSEVRAFYVLLEKNARYCYKGYRYPRLPRK